MDGSVGQRALHHPSGARLSTLNIKRADHVGLLVLFLPDGYAMLMRPNKAETAIHGCHCPGDIAVRMRKVLARPWVGVRVCHLLLLFFFLTIDNKFTAFRNFQQLFTEVEVASGGFLPSCKEFIR